MNKLLIVIILTAVSFNCFAKRVHNNKVYFDNVNGDDRNDGSSWEKAFKTLRYLTTFSYNFTGKDHSTNQVTDPDPNIDYVLGLDREWQDSRTILNDYFYIKATDKPYRISESVLGAGHFYFDALGYAVDGIEQRGTKNSIIYGSRRAIANENWPSWYLVKNGWTLLSQESSQTKIYTAKSPYIRDSTIRPITRAYIDGESPQKLTKIESNSLVLSEKLSNLKNNEYIVTNSNDIYIRNDISHPGNLKIEFIADHYDHIGIEGSFDMWLYGASLRYFQKGFIHGSCITEEIKDLNISYSAGIGAIFAAFFREGAGSTFHNIIAHHNEADGIHLQGYSNAKLFNSIAHNNKGDGIVLVPQGVNDVPMAIVSNNTSANNDGYGYRIYTQSSWNNIYPEGKYRYTKSSGELMRSTSWSIYNNISSNNGNGEFMLEDNTNHPTIWFNGWNGQNNELFNQNSGFSNLYNIDPEFVDVSSSNYHLKSSSPYISKGIPSTVRGRIDLETNEVDGYDIDGDIRDTSHPDIGFDEFK